MCLNIKFNRYVHIKVSYYNDNDISKERNRWPFKMFSTSACGLAFAVIMNESAGGN